MTSRITLIQGPDTDETVNPSIPEGGTLIYGDQRDSGTPQSRISTLF